MKKDSLNQLVDIIEEEIKGGHTMLGYFQLGIALAVISDRLWNIDNNVAQRCNDIQHKIFKENKGEKVL